MDGVGVPEGIDPKFACRIEIIVNSYFSIIDGKKVYNKGRTVSWVVDAEQYGVTDVEKDIAPYIEMSYFKVWAGKNSAMNEIHGTWEDSFTMLWRFKAALEETCPGSIVEIDCKKINGQMHFSRMFVCIKACADGFLAGCRPYLGVDSTHLTGKYNGQFAAATAIDGHNWMYPVAYGIFGKENNANWAWFMSKLKKAIGTPPGLTIHTDACKGLAYGVKKAFGADAEHRECFRHLMANFRKKFKGEVLKYMWPCAWACTTRRHDALMAKIAADCPKENQRRRW